MEADGTQGKLRPPATLFGLRGETRAPPGSLNVDANTTAWEVYNSRAMTIDGELIKDWNDSLNTLLIFAALYSAVLTAFIIESMRLLQEDPAIVTRDVLLAISNQLANNTIPAFEPTTFVAPAYAIRINYYFFLSISSSLIAALGAVLALQWVGSYDAGLNQSSPQDRALQRHFRYLGVDKWKMVQIIAFLPGLIFISLFLFFVGLAEWMWVIHRGVAGIIIAGLICGASFALITTFIGMIYVEAPFRTPASRSLPQLLSATYHSLIKPISLLSQGHAHTIASRRGQSRFSRVSKDIRRRLQQLASRIPHPHALNSFEAREDRRVRSITDIKRTSLVWLMKKVDVLPHTAGYFRSIIRELLLLPPDQLLDPVVEQAPWEAIFMVLLEPYFSRANTKIPFSDWEVKDLEPTLQAFTLMWDIPETNFEFNSFLVAACESSTTSISYLAGLALQRSQGQIRYLFGQLHIALGCAQSCSTSLLVAHLSRLYAWQKTEPHQYKIIINATYQSKNGDMNLARMLSYNSSNPNQYIFPEEVMDILYDILSWRYAGASSQDNSPVNRYLVSVETFLREEQDATDRSLVEDIHDAIITQILGGALQTIQKSQYVDPSLFYQEVLWFFRLKPSPVKDANTIVSLFIIADAWKYKIMDSNTRSLLAHIYGYLVPKPYFSGEDKWNWDEWRIRFYLGLDSLLRTPGWLSAASHQLIWKQADIAARRLCNATTVSGSQIDRLSRIKDPILRLYASAGSNSSWVYPSSKLALTAASWEAWDVALDWWCRSKVNDTHLQVSELGFINAIISTSPQNANSVVSRLFGVQKVESHNINASDWFTILYRPALHSLLDGDSATDWPDSIKMSLPANPVPDLMQLIYRVCSYRWFFEEFRLASGFRWLVDTAPNRSFKGTLGIICSALISTTEGEEVKVWVLSVHKILVASAIKRQRRESAECRSALTIVSNIYRAQQAARGTVGLESELESKMAQDSSVIRRTTEDRHIYVTNWSKNEWEAWKETVSEVLAGLARGYIGVGSTASARSLCRDPDNICSSIHNLIT